MTISVDECIYGTGQEVSLSFTDNSCSPSKSENGHWDASYQLDECGTNAFTENGMIKFENSLTVQSRAGSQSFEICQIVLKILTFFLNFQNCEIFLILKLCWKYYNAHRSRADLYL
mgnify:CR=1 FL=1